MIPSPPEDLDASGRAAWAALFGPPIAHRGLWWTRPDVSENTCEAFGLAAKAGYGVEFDVRLSADGEPMVFHDDDLSRMTGYKGRVEDHTGSDLGRMRIAGLEEMPTLGDAVRVIAGRVLALIELKACGNADHLVERALDFLEAYEGPFAVIAFDPAVHLSLMRRRPDILRGIHIASSDKEAAAAREARAHFILPHLDALRRPATAALREAGAPVIGWTSRNPREHARALEWSDNVIFEGFAP